MSKADEMFKELGYKKFDNHPEEDEQINRMTDEEKKQIEAMKTFNDLFGNVF